MTSEPAAPRSRRDRRRQETLGDLRASALRQLAVGGPAGISMRGIARDLDMTATSVHYYFPSKTALIEALVVDGFSALADSLQAAYDDHRALAPDLRWLAVTRAHRRWALDHSAQYLLIYGHTGGAARKLDQESARAMWRVVTVLFECMRDCYLFGDLDAARLESQLTPRLREQIGAWRQSAHGIQDLPEGALVASMLCYSRLHGAIILELVGHIPTELADRDALFDLQMRHTAQALHRPAQHAQGG